MPRILRLISLALLVTLLPAACTDLPDLPDVPAVGREQDTGLRGRVLLWHTWTGEEVQVLDQMIEAYKTLNPEVEVISIAMDEDRIFDTFADQSASGLGPDLLLVDAPLVYDMAQAGLIQDLNAYEDLDFSQYFSTSLAMVANDSHTYGLPFSSHTQVLFYNRDLVDSPPDNLLEFLRRAANGEMAAINTDFAEAFWGIAAYDGLLIDDENRIALGHGGFANWMAALQQARTRGGFLLSNDGERLFNSFVDGKVAYYVADSSYLSDLQHAMGEDKVGVALLPAGPNGSAAQPLLKTDSFVFSKVSSPTESALARHMTDYLTSSNEQSNLAMLDIGRLPTNNQVRLSPSMPEHTIVVARQSHSSRSVGFDNRGIWQDLKAGALGFFDNFRLVIEGVMTPNEMIEDSLQGFYEVYGLPERTIAPEELCPPTPETITIWHALNAEKARVFEQIVKDFETTCQGAAVEIDRFEGPDLVERFVSEAEAGSGPDLLFASSRWLPRLADQGLLKDISEEVAPGELQQYQPKTVLVMRYDGRLYGIPESLSVAALYYNTGHVSDPPVDLDQLVHDVSADERWALPVGFYWGYWGMDPFGGFDFDSYSGEVLDTTGLVEWLSWLQSADKKPGMDLLFDPNEGDLAFLNETASYLVASPSSLPLIRSALGENGFSVIPLPNGPVAAGSPMLRVQGAMINAQADETTTAASIAFAQFLNLPANQLLLLETGSHVPATVTLGLHEYPHINGFREQATMAAMVIENSAYATMEALGDELYRAVLQEGADPETAVAEFVDAVHAANGVE
ncbi:MAG: extracellular solute-binding protein [Chloroflexota bacterium]|nr:extracellular solute-binding protein [Chloroflexota bacterium]